MGGEELEVEAASFGHQAGGRADRGDEQEADGDSHESRPGEAGETEGGDPSLEEDRSESHAESAGADEHGHGAALVPADAGGGPGTALGMEGGDAGSAQQDAGQCPQVIGGEGEGADAGSGKSGGEGTEKRRAVAVGEVAVEGLGDGGAEDEGSAENARLSQGKTEFPDEEGLEDTEGAAVEVDESMAEAEQGEE